MDQDVAPHVPHLARIRRRLALYALIWTLTLSLLGVVVGQYRLQVHRQELASTGIHRLSGIQDNIENHFQMLAALAQVLARQSAFVDFLHHDIAPPPGRVDGLDHRELNRRLSERPDVRAMNQQLGKLVRDFQIRQAYIEDAYGTGVADSAPDNPDTSIIGRNFRLRDYYSDAMETGAGFQFVMGQISHKPGFDFSARVADGDRALGIVILKTDPESMRRLFTDTHGRLLLITDRNGVVVAGNQPQILLKQMPGGAPLQGREAEVRGIYLDMPARLRWPQNDLPAGPLTLNSVQIGQKSYLVQQQPLAAYPYTLWALTPLTDEPAIVTSTWLATAAAMGCGWLVLWAYFRRLERREAIERARQETLEMTRALPLTLFRYRVDADGQTRFTHVGHGFQRLFGGEPDRLLTHPHRLWGQARLPGQQALVPPTQPHEFSIDAEGHPRRWISVNSAMARTPGGGEIYDGYWLDITARRLAEQRFETVFHHASTAFFFFHRLRGITRCNAATLRLFGADSFDQIEGLQPWAPPLSPTTQPSGEASDRLAASLLDSYRDGDPPSRLEWRCARLDGTPFDAEVLPVWLGDEDEGMHFAIVEDVTARKQTEAALRAANKAAQETTRAKSAFLANMSHEIRTPMNAIIGMTHLALMGGPAEKVQGYVAKAHQAANDLLQIINDVLDMSKIEAGHLELESIEFSVQDVLDQVADVLGLSAERKGLELVFAARADLPGRLRGDPTRLRQILVNLGSNAVKFTDTGSVTMGLEVQRRDTDSVVLHGWVRDTGIGMSSEQQARLFQPFSQVDASTTRRFGGTGLGLSISKQLVEKMGGRLWVDSAPAQGATFHFTVSMGVSATSAPMAMLSEAWQDKRVLLVDDNAEARQVLSTMMQSLGLVVDLAESGAQAVERAQAVARPYHWILLDWQMPGMDGVSCAQRLQAVLHQRFPQDQPCILLVTAFNKVDALNAARDVDLADVLTKPVTPSTLLESLRRAQQHVRRDTKNEAPIDFTNLVGQPPSPTLLAGIRILLVEDQPLNQELARELLTRVGAEVTLAVDGRQALDLLDQTPAFDCVLMDCQMPRMDGYTATRRIRDDARFQHLPVIAMTASALASDREHAIAAGMNDHVPKPLDIQRLYQVIARWVAIARQARTKAT
jgi:signal transduction histidine kinase/DNA-binding response OmpR family regulator